MGVEGAQFTMASTHLPSPTRTSSTLKAAGTQGSELSSCRVSAEQVLVLSGIQLFVTPWTVAHQAPPSMGFSRQEYWRGLPVPPPGNRPNPGIESASLSSPHLQTDFFLPLRHLEVSRAEWVPGAKAAPAVRQRLRGDGSPGGSLPLPGSPARGHSD